MLETITQKTNRDWTLDDLLLLVWSHVWFFGWLLCCCASLHLVVALTLSLLCVQSFGLHSLSQCKHLPLLLCAFISKQRMCWSLINLCYLNRQYKHCSLVYKFKTLIYRAVLQLALSYKHSLSGMLLTFTQKNLLTNILICWGTK